MHGKGGHGAMPHAACDPEVAASAIVMALQTIVSRNVSPLELAIVTVGAFHAGSAPNVIPQSAELKLTVRAPKPEVRLQLKQRITEICNAQAAVFGARVEIDYQWRYPVLVNDAQSTAFARQVALDWVGEAGLMPPLQPLTGSEDFAFFLEKCKGSYLLLGNGMGQSEGEGGCMVHNPGYDFNDRCQARGPATGFAWRRRSWFECGAAHDDDHDHTPPPACWFAPSRQMTSPPGCRSGPAATPFTVSLARNKDSFDPWQA